MKRRAVFVLMTFLLLVGSQVVYGERSEKEGWERVTNPNSLVSLIHWQLTLNPGARDKYVKKHIIGTVENNSKKEFSEIKIEFGVYDEDGSEIATVSRHHNEFKPGGIWKFDIPVTSDVKKAELRGVYVPVQEFAGK